MEHERRVRKRLARLSEAAEDSFSHIKRQLRSDSNMPGAQSSLDPIETAHAVFPAMARSTQKYLRTTRYVPFECAQTNHLDSSNKKFTEFLQSSDSGR